MAFRRVLLLGLLAVLSAGLVCAGPVPEKKEEAATPQGATPRNETLYMSGIQWGAPTNFNPLTGNMSFPIQQQRFLTYEALFTFNMLNGKIDPLVGTKYEWVDPLTLKVSINPAAHWNDGQKLTAEDVAYTYELGRKYTTYWSQYWTYIDSVSAVDAATFVIKQKADKANQLLILDSICDVPLLPRHVWTKVEADAKGDIAEIRKFFNPAPVASGPYKMFFYDDTRITLIRDDNYWGKALFGKLPGPRYITHAIFKSNDAGDLALKNSQVDMSQQFTPHVWDMWKDGTPIRTYLKDLPYFVPASMPSMWFNLSKPGMNNPDVRRAIAMSIDYSKIEELAMSGYSRNITPALTMPVETEQYIDKDAIRQYQWKYDVDGANKLLDSIGARKGADGIRVLNGVRLGPWDLECPYGWTDWNAALEIVAQSAQKIGIELRTKFPEAPVYTNDRNTGNFDVVMFAPAGQPMPSQPWLRANFILYSKGVPPVGQLAFSNYNRFHDDRADAILEQIPRTTDKAELKKLYTELTIIWLKGAATVPLMYRPFRFYTFNTSVWTGFPVEGDNTGVPPLILADQSGVRGLYLIKAK